MGLSPLLPLRHLYLTSIMRRIDISCSPSPRYLLAQILCQVTILHFFGCGCAASSRLLPILPVYISLYQVHKSGISGTYLPWLSLCKSLDGVAERWSRLGFCRFWTRAR